MLALRDELVAAIDALPAALDGEGPDDEGVFEDLKTIIDLHHTLRAKAAGTSTWAELQKASAEYRAALAPRLSPALQARFLLEGVQEMYGPNKGAVHDELLRILCSFSSGTPQKASNSDSDSLARAWNLIREGKIAVNKSSAWLSCAALVEYALKPDSSWKERGRIDEEGEGDGDGMVRNPKVTPAEAFLVLLAFSSSSSDSAIALRISQECDARLVYQPSATPHRIFEGELLSQIEAIKGDLSPAIRHRRQIGIVFDNRVHEYYRYATPFERYCLYCGGFGPALSVELPHLVYALVDRVELDVVDSPFADAGAAKFRYVTPGCEVMLRPFAKKSLEPFKGDPTKVTTISADVKPEGSGAVCTHVSVSLDRTTTVTAVRLYGSAICFC